MSVLDSAVAHMPELQTKIVLLELFNDTLQPPTEHNPSEHMPSNQAVSSASRVLPYIKEKELVETLAFLASITDDPGKVVAACVEEGSSGTSMTVNLAVNNGGLVDVVEGFEKMASVLQGIARKGSCLLPKLFWYCG